MSGLRVTINGKKIKIIKEETMEKVNQLWTLAKSNPKVSAAVAVVLVVLIILI